MAKCMTCSGGLVLLECGTCGWGFCRKCAPEAGFRSGSEAVCPQCGREGPWTGIEELMKEKEMGQKELGKETAGGWGRVIEGEGSDHITVTNSSADAGEGFHVTTETGRGRANVRDYFDNDGNHLGTDNQ